MKDQKERYRQAKEELKRVQEDFRSLRDRLKVMKSSYVLLRSTGLQRFFAKLTHSRWILFNVTFPRFVCAHLSNLIWWIFSQLLRPTSIVLRLKYHLGTKLFEKFPMKFIFLGVLIQFNFT